MKHFFKIVVAIIVYGATEIDGLVSPELIPELKGGAFFLLVYMLMDFLVFSYENWTRLILIIRCSWLAFQKKSIRFSMSYQYVIKINDKYLLVKNSNWDQYQHVGGKYKRLPVSQARIKDLGGGDDEKLETEGLKKDDFAVYIPAKNAIKFLDWFNNETEREVSHWREFHEELIDVKGAVLSSKIFPYVNYEFKKRIRTPLRKSPNLKCWEILQYDLLELIPTPEQKIELEKLQKKGDTDYIKWADKELIDNAGHDIRTRKSLYNIGAHTKWMVNGKWMSN